MTDVLSMTLIVVGLVFYVAGSIGLLRLPDLFCRLHALTKADNLGLGFVAAGQALHLASLPEVLKLLLIWLLVLAASATAAQLISQWALQQKAGAGQQGKRHD